MTKSALLVQTVVKYIAGILLVALLLFLPAGTVSYPGAWLFMALLFVPMFFFWDCFCFSKRRTYWKRG